MFYRIRCYMKLAKVDKWLRGLREVAEIIEDENLIRKADETLHKNESIRKQMWTNRDMARNYVRECLKNGI